METSNQEIKHFYKEFAAPLIEQLEVDPQKALNLGSKLLSKWVGSLDKLCKIQHFEAQGIVIRAFFQSSADLVREAKITCLTASWQSFLTRKWMNWLNEYLKTTVTKTVDVSFFYKAYVKRKVLQYRFQLNDTEELELASTQFEQVFTLSVEKLSGVLGQKEGHVFLKGNKYFKWLPELTHQVELALVGVLLSEKTKSANILLEKYVHRLVETFLLTKWNPEMVIHGWPDNWCLEVLHTLKKTIVGQALISRQRLGTQVGQTLQKLFQQKPKVANLQSAFMNRITTSVLKIIFSNDQFSFEVEEMLHEKISDLWLDIMYGVIRIEGNAEAQLITYLKRALIHEAGKLQKKIDSDRSPLLEDIFSFDQHLDLEIYQQAGTVVKIEEVNILIQQYAQSPGVRQNAAEILLYFKFMNKLEPEDEELHEYGDEYGYDFTRAELAQIYLAFDSTTTQKGLFNELHHLLKKVEQNPTATPSSLYAKAKRINHKVKEYVKMEKH